MSIKINHKSETIHIPIFKVNYKGSVIFSNKYVNEVACGTFIYNNEKHLYSDKHRFTDVNCFECINIARCDHY